jgi:hypothetical protein
MTGQGSRGPRRLHLKATKFMGPGGYLIQAGRLDEWPGGLRGEVGVGGKVEESCCCIELLTL